MSNWNCKECHYTDLECQEQCKTEQAEKDRKLKEKMEQRRGCFGASFNDCGICDERTNNDPKGEQ